MINQTLIFIKKEFVEMLRQGKALFLMIIFVLFGVMNPAIAKLTPIMFESMKDQLEEQGMVITKVDVTAMTSWEQFYKNMPMALIVIVAIFAGILVSEYQKGTLINMLTKGLGRTQVIIAKSFVISFVWTICYWLSFFITLMYNTYFWKESGVSHEYAGAAGIYVLGLWLLSLIIVSSVISKGMTTVLLSTGGAFAVSYVLSIIPDIKKYLPTSLMAGQGLLNDTLDVKEYIPAFIITGILIVVNYIVSVVLFRKKQL